MSRHVGRQTDRSRAMRAEKSMGHREGQKEEGKRLAGNKRGQRGTAGVARQSFHMQPTLEAPGCSR